MSIPFTKPGSAPEVKHKTKRGKACPQMGPGKGPTDRDLILHG